MDEASNAYTMKWWLKPVVTDAATATLVLLLYCFSLVSMGVFLWVGSSAHGYGYLDVLTQFLLAMVYWLGGAPVFVHAMIRFLKNWVINVDGLMVIAAILSYLVGNRWEGGLLLVLFNVAHGIEEYSTKKTNQSLQSLHALKPTHTTLLRENEEERIPVDEVNVGDRLLIKAGERIPLDGEVVFGSSSVNASHVTGESMPFHVQVGDEVMAGSHNTYGALHIRVTHTSADSTLARIIALVSQAQERKPKITQFFNRFGIWYSYSVLVAAVISAIVLPWWFQIPYWGAYGSVSRALSFLITAAPCALIIALPSAYLSALSRCARQGVLLKGGIVLDALIRCHHLILDKTGTLTTGTLEWEGIHYLSSRPSAFSEREWVAAALALERHSSHPIAQAIQAHAKRQGIQPLECQSMREQAGLGVQGFIKNGSGSLVVAVGHPSLIQTEDSSFQERLKERLQQLYKEGFAACAMQIGVEQVLLAFEDPLRLGTKEWVGRLKNRLFLSVLSGDHPVNVERVSQASGIAQWKADLRPGDKLAWLDRLDQQGGAVMVGDGINDVPSLARATVGVAMGGVGSDSAIDVADVILLHDDLSILPGLFDLAQSTRRIVIQNLALSFSVVVLASIASLLGEVPLWLAVLFHEGGTVCVALNGLRLLYQKL